VFLPITALASIFSMTLKSGLEGWGVWVFWLVVAAGVALGLSLRARLSPRSDPAKGREALEPEVTATLERVSAT
jgi:hypothetical protein